MVMFIKNLGHVPHMSLETIRQEITKVDAHIIRLIAQRQELAGKIAQSMTNSELPRSLMMFLTRPWKARLTPSQFRKFLRS
jgi:hypothetical protein